MRSDDVADNGHGRYRSPRHRKQGSKRLGYYDSGHTPREASCRRVIYLHHNDVFCIYMHDPKSVRGCRPCQAETKWLLICPNSQLPV